MNLYKKCKVKTNYFFVNNAMLAPDNFLYYRRKLVEII